MKKIVALLLALIMVLSLTACNQTKKAETEPENDSKIVSSAAKGIIPELPVKLGDSAEDIETAYADEFNSNQAEDGTQSEGFNTVEGNLAVCISNGVISYYYEKDKVQNGISVITVTGETAFGYTFDGLTNKASVKADLPNAAERPANENETYFLMSYDPNIVTLEVECEGKLLRFFFMEETLIGVSLTDTANWTD